MSILLFFSIISLVTQSEWQEFVDLNGRFKVQTPSPLEEKIDTVETELGNLTYHTFFYQSQDKESDNQVFMVSYCDYPEGVLFKDSIDLVNDFFENTMEAAAESVDGEVLYHTDLQLDDHVGKLWRIDYLNGKASIKTKAYLVGNRYYAVQTISFNNTNLNSSIDRFLESFTLL